MWKKSNILFLLLVYVSIVKAADRVCQPRQYDHNSIVCVCNSTYCDDVSKIQTLPAGQYVQYTSSLSGQRFVKTTGTLGPVTLKHKFSFLQFITLNQVTLEIDRSNTYQTIVGFGGAFTDSAGINILSLSGASQDNLLKTYFSDTGIEYNMGRVPISGCDFSTYPYAYNMYPENDASLSNYSLTMEDNIFKIPIIKRAQGIASEKIELVSAAWSPPPWMKTSNSWSGFSSLKTEYYQTWADYHYKFLEKYNDNGVQFWGMSSGNEPINGVVPTISFNSLGWLPSTQAIWITNNLGPTIKNSMFSYVKLFTMDDQRIAFPTWINTMVLTRPDVLNYLDGFGVHWYLNDFIGPDVLSTTHLKYPNKFILPTEACSGWSTDTEDVALGDWDRAETYFKYMLQDLNHWAIGWIDWNLALDRQGGPNWNLNFVDSAIIVLPGSDEFLKQPIFYAMGHFSKFIPRGSVRVKINKLLGALEQVAFLRPDGGIAVICYNPNDSDKTVLIREPNKGALLITVKAKSMQSFVYW